MKARYIIMLLSFILTNSLVAQQKAGVIKYSKTNSPLSGYISNGRMSISSFVELIEPPVVTSTENKEFEGFKVYPNPYFGSKSLHLNLPVKYQESDFSISIFDLNGNKVYYAKYRDLVANHFPIKIDINPTVSGVYLLYLIGAQGGFTYSIRVLKY